MILTYMLLILGVLFVIAGFITALDNTVSRWIPIYMAVTALVCVGVVAMTYPVNAGEDKVDNPTTRAAISAFYVAGDNAQRAIDADICGRARLHELTSEDLRQIRHVKDALQAAYDSVAGSDIMLDIVHDDFCLWVGER